MTWDLFFSITSDRFIHFLIVHSCLERRDFILPLNEVLFSRQRTWDREDNMPQKTDPKRPIESQVMIKEVNKVLEVGRLLFPFLTKDEKAELIWLSSTSQNENKIGITSVTWWFQWRELSFWVGNSFVTHCPHWWFIHENHGEGGSEQVLFRPLEIPQGWGFLD